MKQRRKLASLEKKFLHHILVSGVAKDGREIDVELKLTDVAITIDGHCKLLRWKP